MKYIITKKRNISNQFHDRVKKIIVLCGFILLIVLTSCSEDNGNDDSYEHYNGLIN